MRIIHGEYVMIQTIGAQLYTVRTAMTDEASVAQAFAALKAIGYDEIQTAGFCGLEVPVFARLAADAGLRVCGTLNDFRTMIADPEKAMRENELLGTKNIGVSIMPSCYQDSEEHVMQFIEDANRFAEIIGKNGYRFTYHNHSFEFRKYGGKRILDRMAEEFNPEYITFVLDTYWVQHGGGDVIDWMQKLAGRIDILHLKDMGMADKQFFTEIGNGNINFDGIMRTAEKIGVKHYVVEQDTCPGDPFDSLKMSYSYIHNHFMK